MDRETINKYYRDLDLIRGRYEDVPKDKKEDTRRTFNNTPSLLLEQEKIIITALAFELDIINIQNVN